MAAWSVSSGVSGSAALHLGHSFGRVAIASYEAEMNLVMYATRGNINLIASSEAVTIEVNDEGPGIADIELAMQEGYSTATPEMRETAYQDVRSAFFDYLAHDNDGRGIVFIGHSQGAGVLRRLLRAQRGG